MAKSSVARVALMGCIAVALAAVGAPAMAAPAPTTGSVVAKPVASPTSSGIGSGRALVRIDAPHTRVTKVGTHSYRMVLPASSAGQWLGERTDAQGRRQARVGDLTAGKLATAWTKFRYTSSGVMAALTWTDASGGQRAGAPVRLSQPKVTSNGVRFEFTSTRSVPQTLHNLSINLRRAPGVGPAVRATNTSNKVQILGSTWEGLRVTSGGVEVLIYTAADGSGTLPPSGPYCWSATLTSGMPIASLGAGITCGPGTPSQVGFKDRYSSPAEGGKGDFTHKVAFIDATLYIPGHDPYPYTAMVGSWS